MNKFLSLAAVGLSSLLALAAVQGSLAQGLVDGAFVLKRADFAIGEGSWSDFGTVANEIQIKFHFLAKAK